jgi:hypothetical protein
MDFVQVGDFIRGAARWSAADGGESGVGTFAGRATGRHLVALAAFSVPADAGMPGRRSVESPPRVAVKAPARAEVWSGPPAR